MTKARKIPIPHPGEHLKEILDDLEMSMYAFAQHIGVPQNRITRIVNGDTGITVDTAMRLAKAFGMNVQFWLGLQSEFEIRKAKQDNSYENIRVLEKV